MQFFIRVMHVSRNEVVLGGAFAGSQLHYEMIIVSYLFFLYKRGQNSCAADHDLVVYVMP